jgi:hypothetical protein
VGVCLLEFTITGLTYFCRTIDKVDATMAAVNEQRELANEIQESITNPLAGDPIDDVSILSSSLLFFCR